jgi:hypothetical protein
MTEPFWPLPDHSDPYEAAVRQARKAGSRRAVLAHVPTLKDLRAATTVDRQALLMAQLEQLLVDERPLTPSPADASRQQPPSRHPGLATAL